MREWYVLQSNSRKEKILFEQLCMRKVAAYFPCVHVRRVNPRSRNEMPFFPGYLFVRTDIDENDMAVLQRLPGAKGLVKFGGEYARVEDRYVRELQQKIKKINVQSKSEGVGKSYRQGDRMRVMAGAFSGYEAIFDAALPGSDRVRLLLQWISDKYIKVELPIGDVAGVKS